MTFISTLTIGQFAIMGGVLIALICAASLLLFRRSKQLQLRHDDAQEQRLKEQVAKKAARGSKQIYGTEDENLTDSGVAPFSR